MAEVIWTETSLTDINNIAEYISLDSYYYASQFVEKLFKAVSKLEAHPEIGRKVPELPTSDYREILHGRYRIIYRVSSSQIFIISVHHSSRLLENSDHFKDLFK